MRRDSETFGQSFSCELDAQERELLFIPGGFAHGFLSLSDDSLMCYATDHVHEPANDSGVCWDSFGFKWPLNEEPVMSERDRKLEPWRAESSVF